MAFSGKSRKRSLHTPSNCNINGMSKGLNQTQTQVIKIQLQINKKNILTNAAWILNYRFYHVVQHPLDTVYTATKTQVFCKLLIFSIWWIRNASVTHLSLMKNVQLSFLGLYTLHKFHSILLQNI
jgi:hypothetical protein